MRQVPSGQRVAGWTKSASRLRYGDRISLQPKMGIFICICGRLSVEGGIA